MSQVYSTEPGTTGRVVLDTTHGPIDIDLWCKECPSTTRTFLQLCLDGYYDGMIFHRILSEFLIQTGLTRNQSAVGPTPAAQIDGYLRQSSAVPSDGASSSSGDPLGLDRKKLELNPRIRFNHRGQVAMAFPLDETSAGDHGDDEEIAMLRYQFFVTLDEAPFLDAKHVAFGTIAGATMFNGLRIGRTDADGQSGVPTDMIDCPPRIKGVKVDYHPFEDLVMTADRKVPWKDTSKVAGGTGERKEGELEKRRKKRKGKRDFNVLSFGNEERDYDEITSKSGKGGSMLSSHDVLSSESKFLGSKVDTDVQKRSRGKSEMKKEKEGKVNNVNDEEIQKEPPKMAASSNNGDTSEAKESSKKIHGMHENKEMVTNESKNGHDSEREGRNRKNRKSTQSKGVGAVEARRAKYLKSGSSANKKERLKREGDTMAKLFAFKNKVIETRGSRKDGGEGGDGASERRADDSLASRMANRARQTEDEDDLRTKEEEAFLAVPGYSGRVNEDENERDDAAGTDAGDWMGTKFKCRRHIDNDSRMTALDKIGDGDDIVGGDGRRTDDYVVLDEKRSGRGEKNGHGEHRGHGRRSGSGKHHSGRPHKSSGHQRHR